MKKKKHYLGNKRHTGEDSMIWPQRDLYNLIVWSQYDGMILVWWYDPNNDRDMHLQSNVLYNSMIWPWHAIYNQQTWSWSMYQCFNPDQCINVSTLINVSMYPPWSYQYLTKQVNQQTCTILSYTKICKSQSKSFVLPQNAKSNTWRCP